MKMLMEEAPIKVCGNNLHKLQVNDSEHNEGTMFSKWVNWCQGNSFSTNSATTGIIKLTMLVLKIGSANFLHFWATDGRNMLSP